LLERTKRPHSLKKKVWGKEEHAWWGLRLESPTKEDHKGRFPRGEAPAGKRGGRACCIDTRRVERSSWHAINRSLRGDEEKGHFQKKGKRPTFRE